MPIPRRASELRPSTRAASRELMGRLSFSHFVEQREGRPLIRGPAKDVAAKDQRRHLEPSIAQHVLHCGSSPDVVPTLTYLAVSRLGRAGRIVAPEGTADSFTLRSGAPALHS